MKAKLILIIPLLLLGQLCWGQEMGNFREKHRIDLSGFPDKNFKYEPKDSLKVMKKTNIIYDKDGNIISYNNEEVKKAQDSKILDETVFKSLGLKSTWSNVNISEKDDKVFIYPFTYTDNKTANDFFINNNVYLELEDRQNYSFKYRTWQVGVVTIPVKWYMDNKLGNIETDINAMISGGYKWGKTHIVKLPHEEEARQYQRTYSFNVLAGISKLSLDSKNTVKDNPVEGSVAAISTGISFGVHYKDFTFLIASGFDFPTSNSKSWEFNNIPWLGIGFGYNFLKLAGTSNE